MTQDTGTIHEAGLPRTERADARRGGLLLLATDLSRSSAAEDAHAMDLAADSGARLVILAIPGGDPTADASLPRRLRTRVHQAQQRGVDAHGALGDLDAARSIVRVAEGEAADEVVIGQNQWGRWMAAGMSCGHLMLHTPCAITISRVPEAVG